MPTRVVNGLVGNRPAALGSKQRAALANPRAQALRRSADQRGRGDGQGPGVVSACLLCIGTERSES
jgi:hypothetical protein